LRFVRRDHDLADPPMRNRVLDTIAIQQLLASDAKLGLERTLGIVEARMDHFRVARARVRADALGRLEHDHFVPCERSCPRDRETDDTGTDYDTVDLLHNCVSPDIGSCAGRREKAPCAWPL